MENTDFSGSETVDVWMVQVGGLVSVYDQAQWCLLLGECMSSILLRGSDVPASLGPSPLSMAAPNLYLGSLGDLCACTFFFWSGEKVLSERPAWQGSRTVSPQEVCCCNNADKKD